MNRSPGFGRRSPYKNPPGAGESALYQTIDVCIPTPLLSLAKTTGISASRASERRNSMRPYLQSLRPYECWMPGISWQQASWSQLLRTCRVTRAVDGCAESVPRRRTCDWLGRESSLSYVLPTPCARRGTHAKAGSLAASPVMAVRAGTQLSHHRKLREIYLEQTRARSREWRVVAIRIEETTEPAWSAPVEPLPQRQDRE